MTTRPLVRRACLLAVPGLLIAVTAKPIADGRALLTDGKPNAAPMAAGLLATRSAAEVVAGAGSSGTGGSTPRPTTGYHHLGASTDGDWAGVLGRFTVRDPGVRPGSRDFVATRFMAKRSTAGRMSWLEVGWAETGWSGNGRQRIYTFDTNTNAWTFYEQYPLHNGDQIWIYLRNAGSRVVAGARRAVWQAWLWWSGGWRLLTAPNLPMGEAAQMEQYVEVYVDPARGGTIPVPLVTVDGVAVQATPGGRLRPWRAPDAPSVSGDAAGPYCTRWSARFDDWSAGSCPSSR